MRSEVAGIAKAEELDVAFAAESEGLVLAAVQVLDEVGPASTVAV